MNFMLCIIIVAYFCLIQIKCRSLQVDNAIRSGLEITDDVNHDLENGGRLSWKRLKPILRREVQRISNAIGLEASMFNQLSTEPTSLITSKPDENLGTDQNEDIYLKAEPHVTTTSYIESQSVREPISDSNLPGEIASDIEHSEKVKFDAPLTTYEFPDNAMSDILNQSGDSIVFQALNDNSSKSFEFDETTLLSEGGQLATFQEISTIGSELLIDSETNQNLILTELISSQLNLIDNSSTDFTHEDDSSTFTPTFNSENELQEATGEEIMSMVDETVESNADEIDGENTENDPTDKFQDVDENELQETASEKVTSNRDTAQSNANVIENKKSEIDFTDLFQDSESDISKTSPNCPDPGWCVFWFLAQEDTCAKDSHCHGSLICCMWGCTKACVDAAT